MAGETSLRPAQQLGLLVMSIAALLLVIGETGAVISLSQTSLLVMIVGLMLDTLDKYPAKTHQLMHELTTLFQ